MPSLSSVLDCRNLKPPYAVFQHPKRKGESMLSGEYNHSIDSKGRLIIPSKFRERLGEQAIITKGIDRCLLVFPLNEWEAFEDELHKLPRSAKTRDYLRYIVGSAEQVTIDKMGRALVSQPLRHHAGIDKDVVLVGVLDRIEIWDKTKWDQKNEDLSDKIEDISEELTELGFNI